jgi:hypothetical protein
VTLGTSAHNKGGVVVIGKEQKKKNPRCEQIPRKKRNDDTQLDFSGRRALRKEQCNKMPKSRNSLIASEVAFLENELLR